MKCLKKCGLRVKLQNYNPAITKFSRIWVDIYDKNIVSQVAKTKIHEDLKEETGDYLEFLQNQNENILQYEDEGEPDFKGTYHRGLSGWYVVTEIEIEYETREKNLKMYLTLNRIEYKPCFKSDYILAKKSVKKYKDENLMEDILINI